VLDTIYSSYEPFGAISENDHAEPAMCYQFSLSDGKRLKYGLFNVHNLQWVVPCEYDRYKISQNYLLIGKGNNENRLKGLVNREGEFVVPLQYPDVDYREDDRIAVVRQNGNYGVVDFKGAVLVPFRYKRLTMLPEYTTGSNAFPLPKGYFIFSMDSLCGLMKLNQKVIIPAKYITISPTRSGFICQSGDSCTVVNYSGKTVLNSAPLSLAESISGIFSYNESPDSRIVLDLYGQTERMKISVYGFEPVVVPQIPDPVRVYDSYELTSPASFPGGEQALRKYFSENLNYPQEAMELGIEGKCFLEFEVGTNGKLSYIKVRRGVHNCPECDREAIRVVRTMPDWIPGQVDGIAVSSRALIPVVFRLD
jgi:TonB family protein